MWDVFAKQALGIYGSQIFRKRCWDALNTKCGNMYIYVYIDPSIHPSIHTYIRTYIHTYIHAYIHTYIHTSIHPYIHTSIHPCMHASMHAYIQTCMFETCSCLHHFFKPYIMQIDQFSALASGSSSKLCLAVFTKGWG